MATPPRATAVVLPRTEIKRRVNELARRVRALAASAMGPHGRAKLLRPNSETTDGGVVTTVAERMLPVLSHGECPIANVYFHVMKSKLCHFSDGGLLLLYLSSTLLLEAQDGVLSSIPHVLVAEGLRLTLEWSLQYLNDPGCPVAVPIDWGDTVGLYGLLRGVLGAKPLTGVSAHDLESTLLPLALEAFVGVVHFALEFPREPLPIRFVFARGHDSIAASHVCKGGLFLDREWPARLRAASPLRNVTVALFNVSVDPVHELEALADSGSDVVIAADDPRGPIEMGPEHVARLRQVAERLGAWGVGAVLVQKLVPEFLQELLGARGVLVLDRLGVAPMRALQLLTGARVLGDWRLGDQGPEVLGFVASIEAILPFSAGDRPRIRLSQAAPGSSPCTSWPVTTLVLTPCSEVAFDELAHVLNVAFRRLRDAMEEPMALVGGGCVELHLAAWLRVHAQELVVLPQHARARSQVTTLHHLRTVIEAFARALEHSVVALAQRSPVESDELLGDLALANKATLDRSPPGSTRTLFGYDAASQCVVAQATIEGGRRSGIRHGSRRRSSGCSSRGNGDSCGSSSSSSSSSCSSCSSSSSSGSSDDDDDDGNDRGERLTTAGVLDAPGTKRQALMAAVDAASLLLRVATTVVT